jgi:DNA-binding PadR family transcriptional regulator
VAPIFSHGRLRLYLLKLLEDGPKHGYELMRLLQERFQGMYAPSAGSIYPRLAKMEEEGLVNRVSPADAQGTRMAYTLTEAGRAELRRRADEIAEIDREVQASVEDLSRIGDEISERVSGGIKDIRRQLAEQARQVRSGRAAPLPSRRVTPAAAELNVQLDRFVAEARTLIARSDPGRGAVRAVSASLDATLHTLRDLLR